MNTTIANADSRPTEPELRAWIRDLDYVLDGGYALPDAKRADMEKKRAEYQRKLREFYGPEV
jgi:hypothetical protein